MKAYIRCFLKRFSYPEESREILLDAYEKLSRKEEFDGFLKEYEEKGAESDIQGMTTAVKTLAQEVGVHSYTATTLLFICWSKNLLKIYEKIGISEEIWETSMYDLKYKLDEGKLVHGIWGTFTDWSNKFFALRLFGIGRLQYEPNKCKYNCTVNGLELTTESEVINVHIPRSGVRLKRELVLDSYCKAVEFFKREKTVFACDSWLLFPKNLELLSPSSNLYSFISDFQIVFSDEFENYEQAWRLFDTWIDEKNLDALPQDTSLRRAYVSLMKRGEKTGYGYGVFVYKE
jgi:hypothetical protein